MLGQIDFFKSFFLNRLFLNARTFICWLANFFVLFFLEDARILIFFLRSYCAALVFEIFDFFFFHFFSLNKLCFIFFSFLMHSGDISFFFILITKLFDFQNSKFDIHSSIFFDIQNILQCLDFLGFGGGHSTARMASSKTVFRPLWVNAEHSRYFTAPTSLAIDKP